MSDSPLELEQLRAELAASEARAASAEADLAQVRAVVTTSEAMIRHLKLEIAKLRRAQYGQSSESRVRLIDQMELQLEELEADATEDEIAAERTAENITNVSAFKRRRPARKPLPEHLPRERLVIEAPSTCTCCGSARIVKMGEDITETLEVIPRVRCQMFSETWAVFIMEALVRFPFQFKRQRIGAASGVLGWSAS